MDVNNPDAVTHESALSPVLSIVSALEIRSGHWRLLQVEQEKHSHAGLTREDSRQLPKFPYVRWAVELAGSVRGPDSELNHHGVVSSMSKVNPLGLRLAVHPDVMLPRHVTESALQISKDDGVNSHLTSRPRVMSISVQDSKDLKGRIFGVSYIHCFSRPIVVSVIRIICATLAFSPHNTLLDRPPEAR
jgi:hypothetical protein